MAGRTTEVKALVAVVTPVHIVDGDSSILNSPVAQAFNELPEFTNTKIDGEFMEVEYRETPEAEAEVLMLAFDQELIDWLDMHDKGRIVEPIRVTARWTWNEADTDVPESSVTAEPVDCPTAGSPAPIHPILDIPDAQVQGMIDQRKAKGFTPSQVRYQLCIHGVPKEQRERVLEGQNWNVHWQGKSFRIEERTDKYNPYVNPAIATRP